MAGSLSGMPLRYHLIPTAHERHIARRYLYRHRRSRLGVAVTGVLALLAAAALGHYFLHPAAVSPLNGGAAILGLLAFIAALLLNLFSVFSTVAVVGVMLGVGALTVVMAVTSGFQEEIQQRVIGVNTHVLVLKYGTDFREYERVLAQVLEHPQVVAGAPFVFNEMLIAREGGASAGVLVKGIDVRRAGRVIDLERRLLPGAGGQRPTLDMLLVEQVPTDGGPPLPGAFLGRELARRLKVQVGDRVRLVAPLLGMDGAFVEGREDGGPPATPRSLEVRVAGVFAAGFDEYDRRLVYVDLARAQQLAGQGDVVTGVEMILRDADRARKVARELDSILGGAPYRLLDWEELNHNLFTALALQKAVLGLVLFLIVVVAAFNIVASLTMMVIDKTREVAILKAMGMPSLSVAAVFRTAGMTIGLCGTALGIGMGLLVCAVVRRLGYLLDAKVYLIDRLPIRISVLEVCATAAVTLLICFAATLYPSLRAAALPPADGLRYE
ncbi:MAG: ABC transporter permease [Myxococcales bacterium]|nr:ABC transporter permease [Myxococcota bacterium]MDW8280112.1 ABC transporter permease [Myxococcales bacterium]